MITGEKMKNVKWVFGGIVALIGLVFFVQLMRVGMLFNEYQKVTKSSGPMKSATAGPTVHLPPVSLFKDFNVPKEMGRDFNGQSVSSPFSNYSPHISAIEEVLEETKAIPEKTIKLFRANVVSKVSQAVKDLPEPPPLPDIIDLGAPIHRYRDVRENARMWYVMGRFMAHEGNYDESVACFVGPVIAGHLIEVDTPYCGALIARMIGIAIRNIGTAGIIETAPLLKLPAARLRQWAMALVKVNKIMPAMDRCIRHEKLLIPSVFDPKNLNKEGALADRMRDKALQKKFIDPYFDPVINVIGKPLAEAEPVFEKAQNDIERLSDAVTKPGLDYVRFFFKPEELIMSVMLTISVPNFKKALEQDYMAQQGIRASILMLSLMAYRAQHQSLPASLDELEKWIKFKMPVDIFTGSSFIYKPEGPDVLSSPGIDTRPGTADDMIFYPLRVKK